MHSHNEASARAKRAATVLRDAYGGMHEWSVWLQQDDNPGGNDDADGHVVMEGRYRKAHITIRRGLDAEREREVIAHELAHVLLNPLDMVVDQISTLMPKRDRRHLQTLYVDALEPICERLSRAVLDLIPDAEWEEPNGNPA
jgi:signal transduction histidine kinase